MKRTLNEIYNLIKEKNENAKNDLQRERFDKLFPSVTKVNQLIGETNAYSDIAILIETSNVLTDADDLEKLKEIVWLMPVTTIITTLANTNRELLEWFKNYVERSLKNDK